MDKNDHDLLIEIHTTVKGIKDDMCNFVRQEEFKPVRNVTYGLVTVIMLAVIGAIVDIVIK